MITYLQTLPSESTFYLLCFRFSNNMGGNTYSKEHDAKKPTSANGANAVAVAAHPKSSKEPKPEEKETSKGGGEKVNSTQVHSHQESISKAKSKEGSSKSSKQSSKKKSSPDEETKDIFARIAAGELTSTPVANAPSKAVVVGGTSPAAHGHVVQKGHFRYSPAFEVIRKTAAVNMIIEKQQQQQEQQGKQKPKKSADKMPTSTTTSCSGEDKGRQTSSMVIRMPISTAKSSEGVRKKPKEVSKNEKSHSEKQKKQKSNKSSKEGKPTSSSSKSEPKNKQGHAKSKQSSKSSSNDGGGGGSNKSKTVTTNLEANINAKPKKPSSKDT